MIKKETNLNKIFKFRSLRIKYFTLFLLSITVILTVLVSTVTYGIGDQLFYSDGSIRYEGTISKGLPNGEGTFYSNSGRVLAEGYFKDGMLHGKGDFFLNNRNNTLMYSGEWARGLPNGNGKAYYENAIPSYNGSWLGGEKHGYGKAYNKNGQLIYSGNFNSGKPHGYGALFIFDQLFYEGEFKNGKISGHGKHYLVNFKNEESKTVNNLVYQGEFKNNYYSGRGSSYSEGQIIYEGEFDFGVPYGYGTLYDTSGNVIYRGSWENGYINDGVFFSSVSEEYNESINIILAEVLRSSVNIPSIMFFRDYYVDREAFNLTFNNYTSLFDSYQNIRDIEDNVLKTHSVVESFSDVEFKKLMYVFIEIPDYNYDKGLLKKILKEIEKLPRGIIKDLVALGTKHRFITGHIGDQPEFYRGMPMAVGTLQYNVSGLASYSNKLMVTRLDHGNPVATTLHELGHFVDYFLLGNVSDSDDFDKILTKEATVVFHHKNYDLSYFTNYTFEYFAEYFASFFISNDEKDEYTPNESQLRKGISTYALFEEKVEGYIEFYYHDVIDYELSEERALLIIDNFELLTRIFDPVIVKKSTIFQNIKGRWSQLTKH